MKCNSKKPQTTQQVAHTCTPFPENRHTAQKLKHNSSFLLSFFPFMSFKPLSLLYTFFTTFIFIYHFKEPCMPKEDETQFFIPLFLFFPLVYFIICLFYIMFTFICFCSNLSLLFLSFIFLFQVLYFLLLNK